ncbi:helix-turn-helix transcriptional regulator [Streptomyces sp. NPDC049099]|uniref:helix-turn-helix domain-containing protein n=1 Tax=unclassified Streptomyces TaxID=2593676 RepID=UPI0034139CDE
MTRWRPLPDSLPRECRHLVGQLRLLKGRTGLSLAELARRTAYSKSSWQRYLSGSKLPPRGAVQVLCRLAGADQARLLALWELAGQAWPQGAPEPVPPPESAVLREFAAPPEAETGTGGEPQPCGAGHGRWRTAALAAFAVGVLLGAGLLWALPRRAGDRTIARPRAGRVLSRACRSTRAAMDRSP